MKRGKPVTMKEVAEEAGVTAATVSLVLSKNPKISAVTREKVLKVARRLGYRRNPYVSALMTTRRERHKNRASTTRPVLAFCTAIDSARACPLSPLPGDAFFASAANRATTQGYRLEKFNLLQKGLSSRRATEILYTRNVSGVLLLAFPELRDPYALEWKHFPLVSLGFALSAPTIDRVASDYFQSMMTAIEQCRKRGYRRIGLVLSDTDNPRVNRRWLAAYLMEQEGLAKTQRPLPLLLPNWTNKGFLSWLDRHRPDAVVTPWGRRIRTTLEKNGWEVPRDIGLVTLDSREPDGEVSGIYQNPAILAARAVDMLVDTIERNERGLPEFPNTLFIDGVWNPGRTLAGEQAFSERAPAREKPEKSVSMREVAEHLGVHVSTVSLSLRDNPRVSRETRERVRLAARELGYRSSPYISTLMSEKRTGKALRSRPELAFVTTFPTRDGWRTASPTIVQCLKGARARAEEKGFRLNEAWQPPGQGKDQEFSEELRRRSVQGLMLPPLPSHGLRLSIRWEWFCLVALSFTWSWPPLHRVVNDHYSSMRRGVRECHRLGYRRIGLALSATATTRVQNRWLAAYLMQRREFDDLAPLKPLITKDWVPETVSRWLKQSKPEVIIAPNADPILQWLREWGYSVPRDLGFVSLSCPKQGGPISGIHQNARLLGARAADTLISLIERKDYGVSEHPSTLMVDGVWNPGKTAGTPAAPPVLRTPE